jgi:hypothetical protein
MFSLSLRFILMLSSRAYLGFASGLTSSGFLVKILYPALICLLFRATCSANFITLNVIMLIMKLLVHNFPSLSFYLFALFLEVSYILNQCRILQFRFLIRRQETGLEEDCCLLECDTTESRRFLLMFRRNLLPQSSGYVCIRSGP